MLEGGGHSKRKSLAGALIVLSGERVGGPEPIPFLREKFFDFLGI